MSKRGLIVNDNSPEAINTQLEIIDGCIQNLTDKGLLPAASVALSNVLAIAGTGSRVGIAVSESSHPVKTRLLTWAQAGGSNSDAHLTLNADWVSEVWVRDDTTKPAWLLGLGSPASSDQFTIYHVSAGANPIAWGSYFQIDTSGNVLFGTVTAGVWHGTKIGLAYGGSNADLSATGGANQFVKQSSAGGAFTVGAIGAGDVPDAALTSNVALLNRNAQNFTGTYNRFVQVGVGGAPARDLSVFGSGSATLQVADTAQGATASDGFQIQQIGTGTHLINQENGFMKLYTNGTERGQIDALGNIVPGTAAIAVSATDGFTFEQSCAGVPTGVPTAFTGRVPYVYDSTNDGVYAYNGAWVSVGGDPHQQSSTPGTSTVATGNYIVTGDITLTGSQSITLAGTAQWIALGAT